jgi:hypothetical protein
MKIGITVDIRHSMFSAGHPNSSIAISEALQVGGHTVFFLHKESNRTWWDDGKEIESTIQCVNIDEYNISELDLIIEVGFFMTPAKRSIVKSVWYCRKPAVFNDMEGTVYGCKPEGRDLEGIKEIWIADLFNKSDEFILSI